MTIHITPSLSMWKYFLGKISSDHIASTIADMLGGYHVSHSAKALLKDLKCLSSDGHINKRGRELLATHLHKQFHENRPGLVIINPETGEAVDDSKYPNSIEENETVADEIEVAIKKLITHTNDHDEVDALVALRKIVKKLRANAYCSVKHEKAKNISGSEQSNGTEPDLVELFKESLAHQESLIKSLSGGHFNLEGFKIQRQAWKAARAFQGREEVKRILNPEEGK